jgi:hypothetical protein
MNSEIKKLTNSWKTKEGRKDGTNEPDSLHGTPQTGHPFSAVLFWVIIHNTQINRMVVMWSSNIRCGGTQSSCCTWKGEVTWEGSEIHYTHTKTHSRYPETPKSEKVAHNSIVRQCFGHVRFTCVETVAVKEEKEDICTYATPRPHRYGLGSCRSEEAVGMTLNTILYLRVA